MGEGFIIVVSVFRGERSDLNYGVMIGKYIQLHTEIGFDITIFDIPTGEERTVAVNRSGLSRSWRLPQQPRAGSTTEPRDESRFGSAFGYCRFGFLRLCRDGPLGFGRAAILCVTRYRPSIDIPLQARAVSFEIPVSAARSEAVECIRGTTIRTERIKRIQRRET